MIKRILSFYSPKFPKTVIYMLQSVEYQIGPYLRWLWRIEDPSKVMHRRTLVLTTPAKLLLLAIFSGIATQYLIAAVWAFHFATNDQLNLIGYPAAIFLLAPVIWAHLVIIPLIVGRLLFKRPVQQLHIHRSKLVFKKHGAVKIAVAGSYGKTTMKEILLTVLSEGKKVAATPANKNVAISHAQFAKKLKGEEDILVIEYGEGAPGDVTKFTKVTEPDIGIITGLAPAHLDKYKSLHRAGLDIFTLADYLKGKNVYVNADSEATRPFIKPGYITYSSRGVGGWRVSDVKVSIKGLTFKLTSKGKQLNVKSQLLGRHQIGPLAAVATLAVQLGLTKDQIEKGLAKIEPFEHRMAAREASGAWILDDTYNGNIEGMKAGLELLAELPAKRKVYITPGLVDQGKESPQIHKRLGRLIAAAKPDIVVLMKHSVTADIATGLEDAGYKGQLLIEDDPLNFYNNLDQFIAGGDLVMMQNDWPDNYS